MIAVSQYTEVNLIGIAMLVTILIIDYKNHLKTKDDIQQNFINMIIINTVILLFDNSIYILRGIAVPEIINITYIFCIVCFVLHTWFGYQWFCYVIGFVYPRYQLTKTGRFFSMLPSLICNAIVVSSPFNGWVFHFSSDNVYSRGPLVYITFLVDAMYLLVCTVILLKEYNNPNAIRRRSEYLGLLYAPIPMLIGNILQIIFYGMSIVWIASAVSMMVIYAENQNEKSSRDALTGLYNRRQTDAQLNWELSRRRPNDDLLIVSMIDIDSFKKINDTYGHVTGDEALIRVAQTLQENFRKTDFIGRYGGDEFLMIGHIKKQEDAPKIFQRLKNKLDAKNYSGVYPYNLSASIGYVIIDPSAQTTTDQIISEADQKMYEVKTRRAKEHEKMSTDFSGIISKLEV